MNKTIALDIDATIWNCYPLYDEAAKNIFGRGYKEEDCDDWFWFEQEFGEDYWQIFDEALSQKNLYKRQLYDGVIENISKLKYLGFNLHFVTHNRKSESLRKPLKDWLQESFGDIPLSITSQGNKNQILKNISADVFIDDSPLHLENAKDIVPNLLSKNQPYNQDYLDENAGVRTFDFWDEVPYKVFSMFREKIVI
jgi:5'(3')-deoxyribonucleotidase